MAALLYSEINILCVILMLVIAVRASLLGLDKSVKFKVFIISVLLAAAAKFPAVPKGAPLRADFPRSGEDVAQRQKGESGERSEPEGVPSPLVFIIS